MRVKIKTIAPDRSKSIQDIDFSKWEPFFGVTEEQDAVHRDTYVKFLTSRNHSKTLYLSQN